MLVSVAGAHGQAPVNDHFADRTPLTGSSITFTGALAGATFESTETNAFFSYASAGGGSVWWTWTAAESTTVVIARLRDESSVDSTNIGLYVFTGTDLNALTPLDASPFDRPTGRYVSFAASEGVSYQFRVAGGWLQPFTLKLTATNPPVFIIQPKDCVVSPYGSAFFSAIAAGLPSGSQYRPAATYQWRFNGVPIPGQTAPSLLVHGATSNQVGSYSVIASNAGGLTESAAATLTLTETYPVPRLAALPPSGPSLLSFSLTGEGGRWYKIESSPEVTNWPAPWFYYTNGNPFWILYTNTLGPISIPKLNPIHQFVRASLDVPTDVCVAQLKQMRWAQYMFAIENRLSAMSSVYLSQLKPYLPLGPWNNILPCPESGVYSPGSTVLDSPACNLHARGHQITDP